MTPKTSGNNITEGDRIHNYFISPKLAKTEHSFQFQGCSFSPRCLFTESSFFKLGKFQES